MLLLCSTPSDLESVCAKDRRRTTLRGTCARMEAVDGKQYVTRLRVAGTADLASIQETDQRVAGKQYVTRLHAEGPLTTCIM